MICIATTNRLSGAPAVRGTLCKICPSALISFAVQVLPLQLKLAAPYGPDKQEAIHEDAGRTPEVRGRVLQI